jgi:peptide/nickel transport system substrate-binding protein
LRSLTVGLGLSLLASSAGALWLQDANGSGERGAQKGPAPVDEFHPDGATKVNPAYGGSVTVHTSTLPQNLCYTVENSAWTRFMLYEFHEFLMQQNWETWEYEPRLAEGYTAEDTLILKGGRGEGNTNILYGAVREDGDHYVITPKSKGSTLAAETRVPKASVESLERETVFTFHLKPGVKWHDGHVFDARDVYYSWAVYQNPGVDCDSIRSYFVKIIHGEIVDDLTVRLFYEKQYFKAMETLGDICILPSHIYDLTDPDNKDYNADATLPEQAAHINDNPHNTDWIGLGPYRVTKWSQEGVESVRFDDYFDPENGGYFDAIRFAHISNDDTAFQALKNGDLDFFFRIKGEQYFGEATQDEVFTKSLYKGYYYAGNFGYTTWNMLRPQLREFEVRKALAHCFDWPEYIKTVGYGLSKQVTGPQFYFGDAYNHDVKAFPFDLDLAEEILAEAGWYDHDGDDIIDKDGIPLELEFMMPSGNKASELFGQKLQENLGRIGIKLTITNLEWASFIERILEKDFDCANLAWSVPIESDPEQLWHSDGAPPDHRGSNHSSVNDPYVDKLIADGQRELDPVARSIIFKELHRYLYEEVQPYLFGTTTPRKFGMSRDIRGFQSFAIPPGYSIRRWYYPEGYPGTRPTRAKQ